MNSLLAVLLTKVVSEAGDLSGIDTSQDIKTILRRVENEGESFMTMTLPTFSKDLQQALDRGLVADDLFIPFKRVKGQVLPSFLGGFLKLVFNEGDGRILDSADCLEAIGAVRGMFQISGLLKRLEQECTPKRVNAALDRYIENDAYVRSHRSEVSESMIREFRIMGHHLFADVFSDVNSDIDSESLFPVHGPGATADKLRGNSKFEPSLQSWPAKLECVFPQGRYGYSSYSIYLDEVLAGVAVPGAEIPVKVITVPKTPSTPRIIAIEPTVMQYAQQGVHDSFRRSVNRNPIGRVMSWESQVPNQELALAGSLAMQYVSSKKHTHVGFATLDLKDASDMVDNQLVDQLVRGYPVLQETLQATRSTHADVNGTVIELAKYASMGSALCFPIESIIFTVITFLGLHDAYPTIRPQDLLKEFCGLVRVYGDDIIVPVRAAQSVVRRLESFGMRVNSSKSFWTGQFRESCGKEYFFGLDVTIAKCRRKLPDPQRPIAGQEDLIVSAVALRNNLFLKDYFRTAQWLDRILVKVLNGYFPCVLPTSPILGRISIDGFYNVDITDSHLHSPLVKGYRVMTRTPSSKLDGYGALVKTLGNRSELPIFDPKHLQQAGRPRALRLKLGHGRPF